MHNPESVQGNEMHKTLRDFEIQTDHLILARPCDSQKKKRTSQIVDFAIPADYRVKLKESKKKDKYLDLARELKKLWNMKVMLIPFLISALCTVTQGFIKS